MSPLRTTPRSELVTPRRERDKRPGPEARDQWPFRPIGQSGDVRVGPVLAIPGVLQQLQVQPSSAFELAKVDPETFAHPDNRVSIERMGRLLDACVRLTGCQHFGLLVGMQFKLSDLGPLGDLMLHSQTVDEAIHQLLLHLHWQDRAAAALLLRDDGQNALLGYSLYHNRTQSIAQIYDTVTAITFRILQAVCGESWQAHHVQLAHRRPRNVAPYRQLFHAHVKFDAKISGIAFPATDLGREIATANAAIRDRLLESVEAIEQLELMSYRERVERILHQVIWSGDFSIDAVARALRVQERTLRRRLADEGVNFRQILIETRGELAAQLLENSNLPVASIAAVLRYDDPTAFARAFRAWSGISPAGWRKESRKL